MILQLRDGGIVEFWQDNQYNAGPCDTCDYGTNYVNEVIITMVKIHIHIEVNNTFDYVLSEGIFMKILLSNVDKIKNMTEGEFSLWLEKELENETKCKKIQYTIKSI